MPQTVKIKGPLYRLAKGGDKIVTQNIKNIKIGKSILFETPKIFYLLPLAALQLEMSYYFKKLKAKNIQAGVLHNHSLKPLTQKLIKLANKTKLIVTVEEHIIDEGLGSIF